MGGAYPLWPEDGITCPGGGCEPAEVSLNSDSLKEHRTFLTTELYLSSSRNISIYEREETRTFCGIL